MPGLEQILEDISLDNLPPQWQWRQQDLVEFSINKKLFPFQQQALENAMKALWLYYGDSGSSLSAGEKLKQLYIDNGYQDLVDNIGINRTGFWMATGSGKTLVIIKLIEMLNMLVGNGSIANKDIMFLVYREDLIRQLKNHVDEYNAFNTSHTINLIDLKDYERMKHGLSLPSTGKVINVFYYRADLFVEKKSTAKKLNPNSCDNNGDWYVLLDEAHRGDKNDSPLQKIYNNFARNGFLFNFSATFTDKIDIDTCAFNFNLKKFTEQGHGKKIYVSEESVRGFKGAEEFSESQKQKIVLRTLILKTCISKSLQRIRKESPSLYHSPLILTIVNSVTEKSSDLRLFFNELEKIADNKIKEGIFDEVKRSLANELKNAEYVFDEENITIDIKALLKIEYQDVLKEVFNAPGPGRIDAIVVPGNNKEIVFRTKASGIPFALVRIGDTSKWIKDMLADSNYDLDPHYDDASVFDAINEDNSNIKILMGSRSFYEGWDSNRPNIILFINIGVGKYSKKFVLQAVGRGVRIEPQKGMRKRLKHLNNSGELDTKINYNSLKEKVSPIESLFIFGTDAKNLKEVVNALGKDKSFPLGSAFELNPDIPKRTLLTPVYKELDYLYQKQQSKFPISENDLQNTKELFNALSNEMLLMKYDCDLDVLASMREKLPKLNSTIDHPSTNNPEFMLGRLFDYYGLKDQEFEKFDPLSAKNERIIHFQSIKYTGTREQYLKLKGRIRIMAKYKDPFSYAETMRQAGDKTSGKKKASKKTYTEKDTKLMLEYGDIFAEAGEYENIKIKHLANHYYHPVLLSKKDKVEYLNHIVDVPSEVKFMEALKDGILQDNGVFKGCDWWMFSKLDESLDKIFIPYYNPNRNAFSNFNPDFIFWFQKSNKYYILLVDPKGTEHSSYEHKADGYKNFFCLAEEDQKTDSEKSGFKVREFKHGELTVQVHLRFFCEEKAKVGDNYKHLWEDNINHLINFAE